MAAVFDEISPDLVFAHWPLDTNGDHQIAAMLAVHAYLDQAAANPPLLLRGRDGVSGLHSSLGVQP
jgi:LmbE family N-acetylglucosaminyl deacetylase